jgi:hypothetical protein
LLRNPNTQPDLVPQLGTALAPWFPECPSYFWQVSLTMVKSVTVIVAVPRVAAIKGSERTV